MTVSCTSVVVVESPAYIAALPATLSIILLDLLLIGLAYSMSSYVISQMVICGKRKALSPAARYLPSLENLAHWKGL